MAPLGQGLARACVSVGVTLPSSRALSEAPGSSRASSALLVGQPLPEGLGREDVEVPLCAEKFRGFRGAQHVLSPPHSTTQGSLPPGNAPVAPAPPSPTGRPQPAPCASPRPVCQGVSDDGSPPSAAVWTAGSHPRLAGERVLVVVGGCSRCHGSRHPLHPSRPLPAPPGSLSRHRPGRAWRAGVRWAPAPSSDPGVLPPGPAAEPPSSAPAVPGPAAPRLRRRRG